MGPLTRRTLASAGLLAVVACDVPCEFRILERLTSASSVGCCGAAAVEDVSIPSYPDLAIDLAQVAIADQQGGQDMYLTAGDCVRLFDQPYPAPGSAPRPTPLCPVILGPVAPGRVSSRAAVAPGTYRVFVQAYDSNAGINAFRFDVAVWGASCGASPARP